MVRFFSLLEIMVVITIIALISGVAITNYWGTGEVAKQMLTEESIKNTVDAVKMYQIHNKKFPSSSEGLEALTLGSKAPLESYPLDGWSNKLLYNIPSTRSNKRFDVYSLGADNQEGGEDLNEDLYNE